MLVLHSCMWLVFFFLSGLLLQHISLLKSLGHFLPHQQVDRENLFSGAAAISTNALDQGMRLLSPSTVGKRHMLQQDESTVHHDHIAHISEFFQQFQFINTQMQEQQAS